MPRSYPINHLYSDSYARTARLTLFKQPLLAHASKFLLLLLCSQVCIFTATEAIARTEQNNTSEADRPYRKTPSLKKSSYKLLIKAQALIEKKLQSEAIIELDKLLSGSRTGDYAKALALKIKSYMHYQNSDFGKSIVAHTAILNLDKVPTEIEIESLKSIAQLYYVTGKYQLSIDYFERWLKKERKPPEKILALLAQAYYQVGNYKSTVKTIERAIKLAELSEPVAQESWYLLLRSAHFDQGNNAAAAEILQTLSLHYPKRRYWLQLAGTYSELGRSDKQLSALEIAYISNQLTLERDHKNLVYLYLSKNIPYKAAKVLEQSINTGIVERNDKNLSLLSTSWSLAKEPKLALIALIEAAKLSDSSQLDMQLARLYFDLDDWASAIQSVENARNKDSDRTSDNGNENEKRNTDIDLLYAISLFRQDRLSDARAAFKRLETTDKEAMSEQWIGYIEQEIERRQNYAAAQLDSNAELSNTTPSSLP